MANHGLRSSRGKSAYLDLPGTSVADKAKEHLDLLKSTDKGPYMTFDHAGAADDLRAIGAPEHIIEYHEGMAGGNPQDAGAISDRADQVKQLEEEE
jgi:hypothetical protein